MGRHRAKADVRRPREFSFEVWVYERKSLFAQHRNRQRENVGCISCHRTDFQSALEHRPTEDCLTIYSKCLLRFQRRPQVQQQHQQLWTQRRQPS